MQLRKLWRRRSGSNGRMEPRWRRGRRMAHPPKAMAKVEASGKSEPVLAKSWELQMPSCAMLDVGQRRTRE